jgi:hypothetical protein
MARRDGPTTMAPAVIVPELIRSGRVMNDDAREQRASRVLRKMIENNVNNGPRIRELLQNNSAFEVVKILDLR